MADHNQSAILAAIRQALTSVNGKKASVADAKKVLKYLTGKTPAYFREVLNTTKEKLLSATSNSPLMQRVIGIVSDKGKARIGTQIKKDAASAVTEATKVKEASKAATIAEEVKEGIRYGKGGKFGVGKGDPVFQQLIENAGSRKGARTTFGVAGESRCRRRISRHSRTTGAT